MSATRIRIPRMHGRPPHLPGSTVMRSRSFMVREYSCSLNAASPQNGSGRYRVVVVIQLSGHGNRVPAVFDEALPEVMGRFFTVVHLYQIQICLNGRCYLGMIELLGAAQNTFIVGNP